MASWLWCGALFAVACMLAEPSRAQFGGPPPPPSIPPVKSDLPYIRCGVCEALAKNAYRQVKAAREELKPGKKLGEMAILEIIEQLGNPAKDQGEWIAKTDLVEASSKLKLVEHEDTGKCGSECKTIQRAAEEILEDHDTDIAEKLWQGKYTRAQFSNWLCHELTPACRKKPPPLPKDRKPGPAFEAIDPQEAQMQKMLAGMKDAGLGGQVYDRNTIEKMVGKGEDMFSEDDDDDDDEDEVAAPKPSARPGAGEGKKSTIVSAKDALEAAKSAAGSAVSQAKEGLSKAFSGAKDFVTGLTGSKEAPAAATEL